VIAFTMVSRAFVPHARVLARSFTRHHPGSKLWVFLVDDKDGRFNEEEEPFHILRLYDLDVDLEELHRLELLFGGKMVAVLKPWLFSHFLARGATAAVFLDADCVIFDSLEPTVEAAGSGVILVPHVLQPIPRDGMTPDETTILGAGMFNAGMFGVGPDHGGFIEFLQERLRRECSFDAKNMRFNEQRWLDFVPSLFPHHIVRDPGVDVAYWNLHERPLSEHEGRLFAGDGLLKVFHFSSFDPRHIGIGGKFELDPSSRIRVGRDPLFAGLCEDYRRALMADEFEALHDEPFSFDTLPGGVPVYDSLRSIYTSAVLAADDGGEPYPPDPVRTEDATDFRSWYETRYRQAGLSLPRRLAEPKRQKTKRFFQRSTEPKPKWTVDWLDRMVVEGAADKMPEGGLQVFADRAGFICHGPRLAIDPGHYTVTLEWDPVLGIDDAVAFDRVLVVEAFVRGFVIGSRSVALEEIRSGAVEMDIVVPTKFAQEALTHGLELRVLTRGGLGAQLTAIIVDSWGADDNVPSTPLRFDWMPVMAAGYAGQRRADVLATHPGATGVIVAGPNWRLEPGRYALTLDARIQGAAPDGAIAQLTASVGSSTLATVVLSGKEIAAGPTRMEFSVMPEQARPTDQVGATLTAIVPIDMVVHSLIIESLARSDEGAVPVV
jgi:hypothetical protein